MLIVDKVVVEYEKFKLDISFECKSGEVVAFVGRNGAGKTTTINAILCMAPKTSGKVFYDGKEVNEKTVHDFKQRVGYVGGTNNYYPTIPVNRILKLMPGIYEEWNQKEIERLLSLFELDINKKIGELSTGMRVKLDLAIALSHGAGLYLLDEPTSGLDPIVRTQVLRIFSNLVEEKSASVFFSTHITQDIDKIASRCIFLENGKIVLNALLKDIRQEFYKVRTSALTEHNIVNLEFFNIDHQFSIVRSKEPDVQAWLLSIAMEPLQIDEVLFFLTGGIE